MLAWLVLGGMLAAVDMVYMLQGVLINQLAYRLINAF
jgi:hypothetical protein